MTRIPGSPARRRCDRCGMTVEATKEWTSCWSVADFPYQPDYCRVCVADVMERERMRWQNSSVP